MRAGSANAFPGLVRGDKPHLWGQSRDSPRCQCQHLSRISRRRAASHPRIRLRPVEGELRGDARRRLPHGRGQARLNLHVPPCSLHSGARTIIHPGPVLGIHRALPLPPSTHQALETDSAQHPAKRSWNRKTALCSSGHRECIRPDAGPTECGLSACGARTRRESPQDGSPELAGRALKTALDQAGIVAAELDAMLICTCTGYLCPGLTSYVAEQLGLRSDAILQDLVGLGCGAAIPTIRSASHVLAAHPDATIACVAVEVCSAAFYLDDDPG